jgi:hypothetical protein
MEQKYMIIIGVVLFLLVAGTITILILKKKKSSTSSDSNNGDSNNGDSNNGGGGGDNTVCGPDNLNGTCQNGQACYDGNCKSILGSSTFVIFNEPQPQSKSNPVLQTLSFINYTNVSGNNIYKNYYFPLGLVTVLNEKDNDNNLIPMIQIPGSYLVSSDNSSGYFECLDVYYEYGTDKRIRVYSGTKLTTSNNTKFYLQTDPTGNNGSGVVSVVSEDKSPSQYNIISVGNNIVVIQDVNSLKYLTSLNQSNNGSYMIQLNSSSDSATQFTISPVQGILSTKSNDGTMNCVSYCANNVNSEITNAGWKTASCGAGLDSSTNKYMDCNTNNGGANNIKCSCLKQS